MYYDFETTTYGKWILAGEHAVIRGHAALVFPIKSKQLSLRYSASGKALTADYEGDSGGDLHLLFWSVLEHGMHVLKRSLNELSGHFYLSCNIPIGVGMGASAALCTATARWFAAQDFITEDAIQSFAQTLEDLFHGKSSGLDIAGVSSEHGIYFKAGKHQPIKPAWEPRWYLSSCDQIGITSHCVQQVQSLWEKETEKATRIDHRMQNSVEQAHGALLENSQDANTLLADAINNAESCFQEWELVSDSLNHHMQALRNAGALAVKPTGSGGGGHAISLWDKEPNQSEFNLIRL